MHRLQLINWTGEKVIWSTCAMFFTVAFGYGQSTIRRNWLDVQAAYFQLLSFLEESVIRFFPSRTSHILRQNIHFPSHVVGILLILHHPTGEGCLQPPEGRTTASAMRAWGFPEGYIHHVPRGGYIYTCYTMDWPAVQMCHVSDLPRLKAWHHL